MDKYKEVIFDVETKKLFEEVEGGDATLLGVSVVSAYIRTMDSSQMEIEGEMMSFWESDFPRMWPYFQEADRVVGFNSISFDAAVLAPYADFPFSKLKHFDILQKVKDSLGHRLSLDAIAKDTLGSVKSDKGTNAVYYWQQGDEQSLRKLREYCERDVEITRDIYDYGLANSVLRYTDKWGEEQEVKVDFSYPRQESSQIGLF